MRWHHPFWSKLGVVSFQVTNPNEWSRLQQGGKCLESCSFCSFFCCVLGANINLYQSHERCWLWLWFLCLCFISLLVIVVCCWSLVVGCACGCACYFCSCSCSCFCSCCCCCCCCCCCRCRCRCFCCCFLALQPTMLAALTGYVYQQPSAASQDAALQAMVACPTGSIRTRAPQQRTRQMLGIEDGKKLTSNELKIGE